MNRNYTVIESVVVKKKNLTWYISTPTLTKKRKKNSSCDALIK